jgi:hypothetical protein
MAWDNPRWSDRKSFSEWFTQDGKAADGCEHCGQRGCDGKCEGDD